MFRFPVKNKCCCENSSYGCPTPFCTGGSTPSEVTVTIGSAGSWTLPLSASPDASCSFCSEVTFGCPTVIWSADYSLRVNGAGPYSCRLTFLASAVLCDHNANWIALGDAFMLWFEILVLEGPYAGCQIDWAATNIQSTDKCGGIAVYDCLKWMNGNPTLTDDTSCARSWTLGLICDTSANGLQLLSQCCNSWCGSQSVFYAYSLNEVTVAP